MQNYPNIRHTLSCIFAIDVGLSEVAQQEMLARSLANDEWRKKLQAELVSAFSDERTSWLELLANQDYEVFEAESEPQAQNVAIDLLWKPVMSIITVKKGTGTAIGGPVMATASEHLVDECTMDQTEGLYLIEPDGTNDFGPCSCCGNYSRCVWGYVHSKSEPVAAYYVQWTLNRIGDHGVNFDLVIGKWGEDSTVCDRAIVSLAFRPFEFGANITPIDSKGRLPRAENLAQLELPASEVFERPIGQQALLFVNCILTQDQRVPDILNLRSNNASSNRPWWQFW